MALVKLIQGHHVDAREQRIRDQTAGENAFGEESNPCSRAGYLFESNLIADRFAWLLTQFLCHSARRQSRGQTTWLQHQHLSAHHVEQSGRYSRGFSSARRRLNYQAGGTNQRLANRRQEIVDGEFRDLSSQ